MWSINYFSFITKRSNNDWKEYSRSVPLMIDYSNIKIWLEKQSRFDEILDLMHQPLISDFNYYSVSPFISDLDNNDKNLIEPKQISDQYGNYTLFNWFSLMQEFNYNYWILILWEAL